MPRRNKPGFCGCCGGELDVEGNCALYCLGDNPDGKCDFHTLIKPEMAGTSPTDIEQ